MKMIQIIILLFISSSFTYAQTLNSNDTLHWKSDSSLTWNDFKGDPIEGVGLKGEVFCMNLANFEKPNRFQKTKFSVVSIFDRTKAWITKGSKSAQTLQYFQTMFNIYEVHARKLRKDLSESVFGDNPNPLFQEKYNASMTNLTNEFNEFKKETKLGSDKIALAKWKIMVKEELQLLDAYK